MLADDISASVALQTIVTYHKTYEKYSEMAHKFMDYQARFGTTGRVESTSRFSVTEFQNLFLHYHLMSLVSSSKSHSQV